MRFSTGTWRWSERYSRIDSSLSMAIAKRPGCTRRGSNRSGPHS